MSNEADSRAYWRAECGDAADPLWQAFTMAVPPALSIADRERRRPPWMAVGIAASWVAIAALFAWNVALQNDVAQARQQTALALLAAGRSDRVLAGLATARQLDRAPGITAALIEVLTSSDDPNVQLEALDLLLDGGEPDFGLRPEVLEQVRSNRSFIEMALQARDVRL